MKINSNQHHAGFKHVIWLMVAILFAGTCMLNSRHYRQHEEAQESLLYFPNAKSLHVYTLGYDRAMAKLLWMRTLAYFGGHYATDQDYRYLAYMLDVITRLNPRFEPAYYMGAVTLPWMVSAFEESASLLIRAMNYLPEDGIWPYYLGFNQYLFADNRPAAEHYLARAVSRGYINRFSTALAAKMRAEAGSLEAARDFLLQVLQNKQDENLKEYLLKEVRAIETEIVLHHVERLLQTLHVRTHSKQDLNALAHAGWKFPDILPDGGKIDIRPNGEVYSTANPKRYRLHVSKKQREFSKSLNDE